ncbi:MAG: DMT family transporter [Pseudomonadales bacterium]|nr:DMT family transporter [Pseudomonadales bacterium]MDP6470244.1 DMT family transporter [Pseudomonadales bacterium]MDP6827150.1 DMT family transporter [Pseudomonadales bacterium]MDP6971758.1 DMT family transporter [Pseudomonadales bacterium]
MSTVVRKPRMDALAASILITFNIILGLNQALVKVVNAGFSPVFQAGLRSICAIVPVLAFALLMRRRVSITDGSLPLGLLNGLLFSIEFSLLFLALDYTTVARVSLLFYTMPFWVGLAAHFLFPGERLTVARSAGLLLALGGVALVLTEEGVSAGEQAWIGDLLALAAALAWGSIALLTRGTRLSEVTPEMNLLYQLGVSAVVLTVAAALLGDMVREPTSTIYAVFAFQVIVVVAIGFSVWFWILSIYPVSNMASFSLLAPVCGVFFGALIFDEVISATFIAALALVVSGIVLVNR